MDFAGALAGAACIPSRCIEILVSFQLYALAPETNDICRPMPVPLLVSACLVDCPCLPSHAFVIPYVDTHAS